MRCEGLRPANSCGCKFREPSAQGPRKRTFAGNLLVTHTPRKLSLTADRAVRWMQACVTEAVAHRATGELGLQLMCISEGRNFLEPDYN